MSMTDRGSYFDRLPKEALENVLRFTAEKPRHAKWTCYVDANAALVLLTCKAGVQYGLRKTFDTIEVCEAPPRERHGLLLLTTGAQSRFQFPQLVHALGDSLAEVRVSTAASSVLRWRWKRALLTRAHGLRHLALCTDDSSLEELLAARGARLESLEVNFRRLTGEHIAAISRHARALRRLSIVARLDIAQPAVLADMWRAVGGGLEHITVGARGSMARIRLHRAALLGIGVHCRAARRLAFIGLPMLDEVLAGLCAGLGAQLEALVLKDCRVERSALARMAAMCANVRMEVEEEMGCSTGALLAMGAAAVRVNLGSRTLPSAQLELVSKQCENLESVTMLNTAAAELNFGPVFAFPKRRLREFRAGFLRKAQADALLGVLADRVDSLELLELSCPPSMPVLRKLAAANPRLAKVGIISIGGPGYCICTPLDSNGMQKSLHEENWGTVVTVFLHCKKLREINVSCGSEARRGEFAEFVEACFPARRRNISVRICEHQYS